MSRQQAVKVSHVSADGFNLTEHYGPYESPTHAAEQIEQWQDAEKFGQMGTVEFAIIPLGRPSVTPTVAKRTATGGRRSTRRAATS